MIIYVENSEGTTQKSVRTNKLSKVTVSKWSTYKNQLHSYIQTSWKENKNNSIYNSIKKNKQLGMNLANE